MAIDENKVRDIAIRSEFFQDILDKIPSKIVTWGGTGILTIFIIIGLGFKFVKYPTVIYSDAIVTTEKPPIEIYSRTSGRIVHLLKRDQEPVIKGDWIVILNNSADYKDVLKTLKSTQRISPTKFWSSLSEVEFEELTTLGEIQNSYSQFTRSIGELKLFSELNSQYRQLNINFRREENLISLKQKINNQLSIQEKEFSLAKMDLDRSIKLHSEGFIAKAELEQKEIAYLNMTNRIEELKANLLNAQLQKELLEKENTTLDIEKNDTYFRLRNNVMQYYNNLIFELTEWQNKYVLASPVDGILNLYDVRTEDQFLSDQQKVFTITSNTVEHYFAIVKVPISNSGKVHRGQNCIIKLSNYPYTEFGMLKGKIESISASPKEGFYSARLQLQDQLTTTMHKKLYSKGDLTGNAEIIIDDLTLFDRIFNILTSNSY